MPAGSSESTIWCRHPTNSSAVGWVKSTSSPALARTSPTSRRSDRTTIVAPLPAISASACRNTTGAAGLSDLMDVRAAGQAAADVDELPDPGFAQETYRANQELAITAHGIQDFRHHLHDLL